MRKGLLLLLCLLLPIKLFAATFDQLVMFGDSLSDTGRIYAIFSNAHKTIPAIPIMPKSPPYYHGRFSNGPVWIEHLSAQLNIKLVNYALAGSLAEPFWDSGIPFPWSFETMLDNYLFENLLDQHRAEHLYIIWGGGNDYLSDRDDIDAATTKTVNAIKRYIDKLIVFGATHILVLNLPDLGKIPLASDRGKEYAKDLTTLTLQHNAKLEKLIAAEKAKHAGKVEFLLVDAYYFMNDILADPGKYHLENVSESCYTGGFTIARELGAIKNNLHIDLLKHPALLSAYSKQQSFNTCSKPDAYLFWDGIHPSEAAHKIIAEKVRGVMKENGWA